MLSARSWKISSVHTVSTHIHNWQQVLTWWQEYFAVMTAHQTQCLLRHLKIHLNSSLTFIINSMFVIFDDHFVTSGPLSILIFLRITLWSCWTSLFDILSWKNLHRTRTVIGVFITKWVNCNDHSLSRCLLHLVWLTRVASAVIWWLLDERDGMDNCPWKKA